MYSDDKKRREKESAERKLSLAQRLDSDPQFRAALRFYTEHLGAGQLVSVELMNSKTPLADHSSWKDHLEAARRVLGVRVKYDSPRIYILPANWPARVRWRIGIELWDTEFKYLNPDLVLDAAMEAYAEEHPILDRVRKFLSEGKARVELREAEAESLAGYLNPQPTILDLMSPHMRWKFRRK